MSKAETSDQLKNIDEHIRKAEFTEARKKIRTLKTSRFSAAEITQYSKLAVRLSEADLAYAVLKDYFVDVNTQSRHKPAFDDYVSFGLCIKMFGASEYALTIFDKVQDNKPKEYYIYKAITLFSLWRYTEAVPLLEEYVQLKSLSRYEKLIGQVNLSSALLFVESYDRAEKLLNEIIESCENENYFLLRGNAHEIKAQLFIQKKDYKSAEKELEKAAQFIKDEKSLYYLLVEKLRAVCRFAQNPEDAQALRRLNEIRSRASENNHWETVRDCDYYFAVLKKDLYLLHRLYAGSPYESFRAKLLKGFGNQVAMPDHYEWLGTFPAHLNKENRTVPVLDLRNNEVKIGGSIIKKKSLNFKILQALSHDFYKPIKPFQLYLEIFPDEKLDAFAARNKIFTCVSRLKKILTDAGHPLDIKTDDDGYRFDFTAPLKIIIEVSAMKSRSAGVQLAKFREFISDKEFSVRDFQEHLKYSLRTAQRLINQMCSVDELQKLGKGKSVRYKFNPPK